MKSVLLAFGCMFAVVASAGDLYVDKDNENASDVNPGTEALPFKSIQAAVAYAADSASGYAFASGDTIWVKPGVYDNGWYVDSDGLTNRVYVTKPVRLVATGNRDDTSIVGAWDTSASGSNGCGPNAIRCMTVTSAAAGTIIRGFTITKGATGGWPSSPSASVPSAWHAGGVLCGSVSVYLVECTVSSCRAGRAGAMSKGTAVRSFFKGNYAGYVWGSVADTSYFLNCIMWGNGSQGTPTTYGRAINCTLVGNKRTGTCDTDADNVLLISPEGDYCYDFMTGHTNNLVTTHTAGRYQIMSTATCDFRLLPTSAAIGAGLASHLSKITLPTELADERYKDYYGNAIPQTGAINCGAVQAVGAPQGGGIGFDGKVQVDDAPATPVSGTYVFGEHYPTQYVVKAVVSSGQHLFALDCESRLESCCGLYPDRQNRFFLMPSPNGQTNDWYVVQTTTNVKWVDANSGSDSNDGTEALPYKTLEKAMVYARNNNNTIVYCQKGRYDSNSSGSYRLALPTSRYCAVRAVDGPEETFIVGGTGVGCVSIAYYGCVQGFTLTGADTSGTAVRAAAFGAQGKLSWLLDCVVSNNVSGSEGALRGVWLQRCLVADNRASQWVMQNVRAISSVLCNNASDAADYILNGTRAYQSTLYNEGDRMCGAFNCYNCILAGSGEISSACHGAGNTVWGPTRANSESGWTEQNPYLAAPQLGDCRVAANSPTIGGGEKPTADNYAAEDTYGWRILSTSTYDGGRIRFAADGTPDAGAIQYDHPSFVTIVEGESGALAVTGDVGIGATEVEDGETVTFTIARGASSYHPCIGFTVNAGSLVSFDDYPSGWTTNYTANGDSLNVQAVFSNVFYAAPDGSDANNGWTRSTPKTLQGAIDFASKYGDTVLALAGQYKTGSCRHAAADSISARIAVSNGVTVVSDEGPEKTFIVGAASTDASAKSGCGPDAVRCVRMYGTSRLRGFTLTGGYSGLAGATSPNNMAPAACCAGNSCYIEGCIISNNCVAYRGGSWNGTFVGCHFLENRDVGGEAAALYYGRAINCFFDYNHSDYLTEYASDLVNCTFGSHNYGRTGTSHATVVWGPGSNYRTYNCLFLAGAGGGNSGYMRNCVFVSDGGGNMPGLSSYGYGYSNVIITNRAAIGIDSVGRPLSKSSLTVDYGSTALYSSYVTSSTIWDFDFGGSQRIYNGAIDAGCYEFDWRGDFARDLDRRRATVDAASPDVTETSDGKVKLVDGTTLALTVDALARGAVKRTVPVTVTGAGTLTVTVDGVATTYTAGTHEIRLESATQTLAVELSFAGDGAAEISRFRGDGLLLILR